MFKFFLPRFHKPDLLHQGSIKYRNFLQEFSIEILFSVVGISDSPTVPKDAKKIDLSGFSNSNF